MRNIFILLFFLVASSCLGQYNETIRTARPGQAFGPFTTGKNIFQLQTGATFDWIDRSNSDISSQGFSYLLSLRYGLLEKFEIRSAAAFRRAVNEDTDTEFILDGISLWNIGIRYNIIEGKGNEASFAFQTDVRLNFVSEDFEIDEAAPRILLLHSQGITDKIGLTTNWGLDWDGISSSPRGIYVVNFSFPIAGKFGAFVETFGGVSNSDFTIFFDTGLSYLVNNDLQLDVSVGYGKNNGFRSTFIDFGLSWRTNKWKGEGSREESMLLKERHRM